MVRSRSSVQKKRGRPVRTLGDVLDLLPNRKLGGLPLLKLDPLPNDTLPALEIPGFVDEWVHGEESPDHFVRHGADLVPQHDAQERSDAEPPQGDSVDGPGGRE